MTKVECPQVQTDRQWPFCWPSWLSFVGQSPYPNLNESLMETIQGNIVTLTNKLHFRVESRKNWGIFKKSREK